MVPSGQLPAPSAGQRCCREGWGLALEEGVRQEQDQVRLLFHHNARRGRAISDTAMETGKQTGEGQGWSWGRRVFPFFALLCYYLEWLPVKAHTRKGLCA